jgi:3-hydroxyisobutyrate dehydrogenase-like beta-hydroxyacid dehydrogenase
MMQGQVGIIGIGLLGKALSDCLACAGFEMYGYDIAQTESGAVHLLPSASAVFEQCDTVLLSLPNSNVAASVIDDVIDVIAARHCILDTTTGDPEQIEALGVRLAKKGASYLEANVAGSSVQMRERKAVLLLGGEADVVAAQEPLFSTLAKKRFHVGSVGAGSRFKLVHNLILGLNRAALAEGLNLAEALGFEAKRALEILKQTPASSGVMETKGSKMATRNYEPPQARLAQHHKDVRLILELAAKLEAKTPLSAAHRELLARAEELGFASADNAAIIEAYRAKG